MPAKRDLSVKLPMTLPLQIRDIKKALNLRDFDGVAAHLKMAPVPRLNRRPTDKSGQARLGGVLLLLYCDQGELYLILTRRRDDLQSHAGQVSFPGGRRESTETLEATALRETHEEIGVRPEAVTILGQLTPLYIFPSDFEVHPYVAWYNDGKRPVFSPSDEEVAEIIEAPVSHLLDPNSRGEEMWNIRGYDLMVPFFEVAGHKVWGATAMMLSEFLDRLRVSGEGGKTLEP
jgi:8-oxo-dGTP pyrophosphatase MutT (NUDIX family)